MADKLKYRIYRIHKRTINYYISVSIFRRYKKSRNNIKPIKPISPIIEENKVPENWEDEVVKRN